MPGASSCTHCLDYGNECCEPFQARDATLREAVDQWFDDRRTALKVYGPIKDWDISKVSTLNRLFDGLRNYHGHHFEGADLSGWNTSSVSDISMCFANTRFNSDVSEWDTSRVKSLHGIFANNSRFNKDLSGWNVAKVTDFSEAFQRASSFKLKSVLDSSWGAQSKSHYDPQRMYKGTCAEDDSCGTCSKKNLEGDSVVCGSLQEFVGADTPCEMCTNFGSECCHPFPLLNDNIHLAVSTFLEDQQRAQSMYGPIEEWDTSRVTSMSKLFCSFSHENWCTPHAKPLAAAFNKDVSKWDVGNVVNFYSMFIGAKLFNGSLHSWDVSKAKNSTARMFTFASNFKGSGLESWSMAESKNIYDMFAFASAFNGDLSKWDVGRVTTLTSTFYGAKAFNADIGFWNTAKVEGMTLTFASTDKFNSDISRWDVSKVKAMQGTFSRPSPSTPICPSGTCVEVTIMKSMFSVASLFNSDISRWDVSGVKHMEHTFSHTKSFNADLSKWDVSRVTRMNSMFYDAWQFNSDISRWNVSNVASFSSIFSAARRFNIDVSKWSISNGVAMNAMFKNARSFNFKASLDRLWKNQSHTYPGTDMFLQTCSLDPACGSCGSADTSGRKVQCKSYQSFMGEARQCFGCTDYGAECCSHLCPLEHRALRQASASSVPWATISMRRQARVLCAKSVLRDAQRREMEQLPVMFDSATGKDVVVQASFGKCLVARLALKDYSASSSSSSICRACPAGKFSSQPGMVVCNDCETGKFSRKGQVTCAFTASTCPRGTYADHSACRSCEIGMYNEIEGQDECVECPAGRFASGIHSDKSSLRTACTLCNPGYISSVPLQASSVACQKCSWGKYSNADHTACYDCPAGRFGGADGLHLSLGCTSCKAGRFNAQTGQKNAFACEECDFKFSTAAAASCKYQESTCPHGTFAEIENKSCTVCDPGRFTRAQGERQCTSCGAGQYGMANRTGCIRCPPGRANPFKGMPSFDSCILCQPGTHSTLDQTQCQNCSAGSYSEGAGQSSCTSCDEGSFNAFEGQGSADACLACAPGFFNNKRAQASCEACQREPTTTRGKVRPKMTVVIVNKGASMLFEASPYVMCATLANLMMQWARKGAASAHLGRFCQALAQRPSPIAKYVLVPSTL